MSIETVITEFKKLDLTTYPEKEIRGLLGRIGKMGFMVVTFHEGKIVMRARPNKGDERFTNKSELSFKPQKYNKTYQRASTPFKTMFYATSVPDRIEEGELDNLRIIGVVETIPMMRDKTKSGIQRISFGKWVVQQDLNLIAVVHEESYYKESSYTRELVNAFKGFITNHDTETIRNSLMFQSYIASEFSKSEIRDDYDYMISAIFAETMSQNGIDGILYPSVRTSGKGFNIAILPESVDKLKLEVVGECTLFKKRDQVVVSNDAITVLDDNQESFELVDQKKDLAVYLNQIGAKTLDELK